MIKRCFVLLFVVILPLLYSCQELLSYIDDGYNIDYSSGKVVTGEATDIGAYSVILSGSIQDESLKDAEFGVVFTLHDKPAVNIGFGQGEGTALCTTPLEGNTFSVKVEGLKSESLVYYRAFARKNGKFIMGDLKSFTSGKFNITSEEFEVSDIQTKSANVGIKFSIDTDEVIPFTVYFYIKVADVEDNWFQHLAVLEDDGYYRANIEHLLMEREYEVKAEYTICGTSFYSDTYRFSTAGLDIRINLLPPERINQMFATLGVEVAMGTPEYRAETGQIIWSDTATTVEELVKTGNKTHEFLEEGNTSLSWTIGPLKEDTEYYYTVGFWTTFSEKQYFSEVSSFRTTSYTYTAEPVDLGLSVKWSKFNLGATSPEEYGAYFSWGETSPKYDYRWEYYKWAGSGENIVTKYCPAERTDYWSGNGPCDDKNSLDMEDDAARQILGGGWRIPSAAECDELLQNCSVSYQRQIDDGGIDIWGWDIKGPNGNCIFLPAAGGRDTYISDYDHLLYNDLYNADQTLGVYQSRDAYYWGLDLRWWANQQILYIDCGSFTQGIINSWNRNGGLPIRPVLD